jgi:ribonuclease HI
MRCIAGKKQIHGGAVKSNSPALRPLGCGWVVGLTSRPLFLAQETEQYMRTLQQVAPKRREDWKDFVLPKYPANADRPARLSQWTDMETTQRKTQETTSPHVSGEVYYFDGSHLGKGGTGAGALLKIDGIEAWSDRKPLNPKDSNNLAEYHGMIMCLKHLLNVNTNVHNAAGEVLILGDSQLVIEQTDGSYETRQLKLKTLRDEAQKLLREVRVKCRVSLKHVYREHNCDADKLAKQAAMESKTAARSGEPEAPI